MRDLQLWQSNVRLAMGSGEQKVEVDWTRAPTRFSFSITSKFGFDGLTMFQAGAR